MERSTLLRSLVNHHGFGLEIGPSHAPVFARADGFNIETLDHATADELRTKYLDMGIDPSRIEDVTYVSDGRPLHEVIPRRGEYDYIFSSHAIEHVTDLVGYFRSCELLLKPEGIAALAIPDKRYTFDILQTISTTGQALEAHARSSGRHSPGAVFDFNANIAMMGGLSSWSKNHRGPVCPERDIHLAQSRFNAALDADTPYQDIHGWVFTPNSFRLIMHDLKALGLIGLSEIYMRGFDDLEFFVALSRDHVGHGLDRMHLHHAALREQVVSGMQVLANHDPAFEAAIALIGR